MNVTVLVPTYRRPSYLARCLAALERQTRPPNQVLVVQRDCDEQTRQLLESSSFDLPLEIVTVAAAGQVAALNAGLTGGVRGEVVAITDDDAAPHSDWLERIVRHFTDNPFVAGVGGRDYICNGIIYGESRTVGKIQWFGRPIGNHHRGIGPPRFVDVLKGANMSYRVRAIGSVRFDTRLLGAGAQICNDMSFSLQPAASWFALTVRPLRGCRSLLRGTVGRRQAILPIFFRSLQRSTQRNRSYSGIFAAHSLEHIYGLGPCRGAQESSGAAAVPAFDVERHGDLESACAGRQWSPAGAKNRPSIKQSRKLRRPIGRLERAVIPRAAY